jgi:hypothetical protein
MIFERLFRPKTTRIELDLTDAQIVQLRTLMDGLPMNPYIGLVVAVVKKLPLESADCPPSVADARPAQNISESGCGFSLHAFTPKGQAGLAHIERVLDSVEVIDERLPHGSNSL